MSHKCRVNVVALTTTSLGYLLKFYENRRIDKNIEIKERNHAGGTCGENRHQCQNYSAD